MDTLTKKDWAVSAEVQLYDMMVNLRSGLTLGSSEPRLYSGKGVLLDNMFTNLVVDAEYLGITTSPIPASKKDLFKLFLDYGMWMLTLRNDLLSKIGNGVDVEPILADARTVIAGINQNGATPGELPGMYTQFGLTAP